MIELPEAVVLARQINETLRGQQIAAAAANTSPHKFAWYTGDPAEYSHLLPGNTIQNAAAHGNHVEITTDTRVLVISTPIKYHPAGARRPEKHQLLLEFGSGAAVTCTVQMWGALECLAIGQPAAMPDYAIAKEKPSPLEDAFDRAYFASLLAEGGPAFSAKEFLATRQRIPGLGNGVLQDILWTTRIHPRTRIGSLSDAELDAMFAALKQVLAEMVRQGGRDTDRDLFDRPGGYTTILSKNTLGQPCPACATEIRKEPYLGGVIYFCSICQEIKK